MNPYESLIGPVWSSLPESVRLAHTSPLRASGVFAMRRARSRVGNWLADRLGLPAPGAEIPVSLVIADEPEGQVWSRVFAGRGMRTVQTFESGCMIETTGTGAIVVRVSAEEDRIRYRSVGVRFGFLRVPGYAAPSVTAVVSAGAAPNAWRVRVQVNAPLIGFIGEYEGEMRAEG